MKFLSRLADALCQDRFDERVNIFICAADCKYPVIDIFLNTVKTCEDLISLLPRQNSLFGQHAHVGTASAHILMKEFLIKSDRLIEIVNQPVCLLCEASAP